MTLKYTTGPLFIHVRGVSAFGGDHRSFKRKTARPLSTHHPMRIVFKVRDYHPRHCLLTKENSQVVKALLKTTSQGAKITVQEINVKPYSLQIKIRGQSRESFKHFFRSFTGLVARKIKVIHTRKYKFWGQQMFTQILSWLTGRPSHQNVTVTIKLVAKHKKYDQQAPP